MSDLIYRKDAIRETWKEPTYSDPLNVLTEMRDRIEALPSADKGRWIPCSERLPEKHQMVLTTIKGVDLFRECMDKNFFEALATAKKRTFVSVGYLGDDGWYGADGFPQIIPTVAWMPMPEAYGGQEDE